MHRELLLLGLLRRGDMHGYRLTEFIHRDMAFCTDLKKPTAYHLLQKMEQEGWIVTSEAREGNRPPRRVYQVTPAGEAAFQRLLRENLAAHDPTRFAGDIGLAFVDDLPPAEACALLAQRRAALAGELAAMQTAHGSGAHGSARGLALIIEHHERHLNAELLWLDEVIERLTKET